MTPGTAHGVPPKALSNTRDSRVSRFTGLVPDAVPRVVRARRATTAFGCGLLLDDVHGCVITGASPRPLGFARAPPLGPPSRRGPNAGAESPLVEFRPRVSAAVGAPRPLVERLPRECAERAPGH